MGEKKSKKIANVDRWLGRGILRMLCRCLVFGT